MSGLKYTNEASSRIGKEVKQSIVTNREKNKLNMIITIAA